MAVCWYTLNSHPHKEESLWRQLLAQELEVYYPRMQVKPINPRSQKIRPYFPGYLFVRADLAALGTSYFQWMPFTRGLVSFGGDPSIVPEELIARLKIQIGEVVDCTAEKLPALEQGDRLRFESGLFSGYEAIFDVYLPGEERARVLLQMLDRRQVPVVMDTKQIVQASRSSR